MGKTTSNREQIDKIASQLGLSRSAVYFALAGTGKVSQATRERVHHLAQELGYQPNSNARALRTHRTNLIGVIMATATTDLYDEIIRALTIEASTTDYRLLFTYSYGSPTEELDLLQQFTMMNVDGIIIHSQGEEENCEAYRHAAQTTPIVFMDAPVLLGQFDTICVDNFAMGYLAGSYLMQRGYRRLAYLHPQPEFGRDQWWNCERCRGFTHALQEVGCEPPVELGLATPSSIMHNNNLSHSNEYYKYVVKSSPHVQFALQVVTNELAAIRSVEGIFTANDELAYGVIAGLAECGVRIPTDMAVIGCDDRPTNDFFSPPLTSLHQPFSQLGTEAMRLLMQRINRPEEPLPPQRLALPSTIIPRTSCGERTMVMTG